MQGQDTLKSDIEIEGIKSSNLQDLKFSMDLVLRILTNTYLNINSEERF